jgi:hypothetical protein
LFEFKSGTAPPKKSSINFQKTFGSSKQIVQDKSKTPLPGVNVTNAVETAVS